MRKFKLKRTYRKERTAWVAYAVSLEDKLRDYHDIYIDLNDQLIAVIEERNALRRDFEYMEKRYRNV